MAKKNISDEISDEIPEEEKPITMSKKDIFPDDLIATVEANKNIQVVYIEVEKGIRPVWNPGTKEHVPTECNHWHFNHATMFQPKDVNGKPIGSPYLAVNGKKVTKYTREEVLA